MDATEAPDTGEGLSLIYDANDPTSVVNMVSDRIRRAINEIPPEYFDLTEGELAMKFKPTSVEHSLRVSFWREYEKALSNSRTRIVATEIFGGICTENNFYRILKDSGKVAWLVRPVQAYQKEMEALLHRGSERLWEVMDMELTDTKGKIVPRRAMLWLQFYREISNRAKGMAVQRIKEEKKSTTLHLKANLNPTPALPQDMGALRKRLAEIDARTKAPHDPVIVDAEVAQEVARETPTRLLETDEGLEITVVGD